MTFGKNFITKALAGAAILALAACGSKGGGGGNNPGNDPAPVDKADAKISEKAMKALSAQSAMFQSGTSLGKGQRIDAEIPSEIATVISSRLAQLGGSDFNRIVLETALNSVSKPEAPKSTPKKEAAPQNPMKLETQRKLKVLAKAIEPSKCEITAPPRDSGRSAEGPRNVAVTIGGPRCPVTMKFAINIKGNPQTLCKQQDGAMNCDIPMETSMEFSIVDGKLQQDLESKGGKMALGVDMKMSMKGAPTQDSAAPQKEMTVTVNAKLNIKLAATDLDGKEHSIEGKNDVNVTIVTKVDSSKPGGSSSAPVPQLSGNVKEEIKYVGKSAGEASSLSCEASFQGSADGKTAMKPVGKFFVDGVSVTAEVYEREREKFAGALLNPDTGSVQNPGQQPGPQPGPTEPPAPGPTEPTPGPQPGPTEPPAPGPIEPTPPTEPSNPAEPVDPDPEHRNPPPPPPPGNG